MGKNLIFAVLLLLAGFVLADSDATGVLTGSNEVIPIRISNSTGSWDSNANCTIRLVGPDSDVSAKMSNYGDGRYYYSWSVPATLGVYYAYFNCTTLGRENITAGGSFYVVPRLLEKSVAHGVDTYGSRYGNVPASVVEVNPNWMPYVAIFAVALFVFVSWIFITHK